MSIFEKVCPQCASSSPVHAVSCDCGYFFDPEHAGEEHLLQEERLYRDYLAARLVQAEAALTVARTEAAADPENQVKAAQALLAEQALNATRAELRELAVRNARSRSPGRPAAVAVAGAAAKSAKPQASKRPVVSGPTLPHAGTRPAAARSVTQAAKRPVPVPPKPAPLPLAKARPATPVPVAAVHREITETPGPVFRAVQTVKAETAIKTRRGAPKRAPERNAAAPQPAPKAHPAPVAAAPATPVPAKSAAPKPARKECPHCTALLPLDATRCRCGFSLPTVAVEMPPVALDAETVALLKGLDLGSGR